MFVNAALAALPAIGFAMVFNVPGRYLWACGVAGSLGFLVRESLLALAWHAALASLIAALAIGALSAFWARHYRAPMQLYAVAAAIPLMPGHDAFVAFNAMLELLLQGYQPELWITVVGRGLQSVFVVAAITLGLTLANLLYHRRQ
ncbi:threonine/serine exporter family protein [Ferrimonas gelatinilytica]|uniref:Threonine/serine exporter family protein n=1 Tax=Ferrimonas gelatinilytica TaxID=1255257 RepID=A0ABP9S2E9_9GAMM